MASLLLAHCSRSAAGRRASSLVLLREGGSDALTASYGVATPRLPHASAACHDDEASAPPSAQQAFPPPLPRPGIGLFGPAGGRRKDVLSVHYNGNHGTLFSSISRAQESLQEATPHRRGLLLLLLDLRLLQLRGRRILHTQATKYGGGSSHWLSRPLQGEGGRRMREGEGEGEGRGRAGVPGPVISPKAVAAWKELFFASKGDKGGEGEGGVASKFVAQLNAREREALRKALSMDEQQDPVSPPTREKEQQQTSGLSPPSWRQLKLVFYHSTFPFIGFGFLDNAIMIIAGEYIEMSFGLLLGISTMAAAGLGNIVSDLAGLGLANYVEVLCRHLGLPTPSLTPSQLAHRSVRWSKLLGRCVGIVIGCIIGMCPLFWFESHSNAAIPQVVAELDTTPSNSKS